MPLESSSNILGWRIDYLPAAYKGCEESHLARNVTPARFLLNVLQSHCPKGLKVTLPLSSPPSGPAARLAIREELAIQGRNFPSRCCGPFQWVLGRDIQKSGLDPPTPHFYLEVFWQSIVTWNNTPTLMIWSNDNHILLSSLRNLEMGWAPLGDSHSGSLTWLPWGRDDAGVICFPH